VWEQEGPPVHIAAALYLGLTKAPKKATKKDTGNLEELAAQFAGNGGFF
jgi:hypothetical protein